METQFSNGSSIPEITDATEWISGIETIISDTTTDTYDSYTTDLNYFAQNITLDDPMHFTEIVVDVAVTGSPVFSLRGYIYTDNGSGEPDTLIASSYPITMNGFTGGDVSLAFSEPLAAGSYVLTFDYLYTTTHDASNYITFGANSAGTYTGGSFKYKLGSSGTWSTATTAAYDMHLSIINRAGYRCSYDNTESNTFIDTTIANTGWHVPDNTEINTLFSYAGTTGSDYREDGYWAGGTNNNTFGFNFRGSGLLNISTGTFSNITNFGYFWSSELNGNYACSVNLSYYEDIGLSLYSDPKTGIPIRLVKDSTTLSDGETGNYIGNDGKVYKTICIGTQEWLSENLIETLYRDGSSIPEVADGATWVTLSTGARCSYDNTETNAVEDTNIANENWSVPSYSDYSTLSSYLGSNAGNQMKEVGTTYWEADTGHTNSSGFNGRGSGMRDYNSVFNELTEFMRTWVTNSFSTTYGYIWQLTSVGTTFVSPGSYDKNAGLGIRLVKDSTTLSDGESGTYEGNDGKIYRTICIGTQEWLADNLAETKYRNGSLIPNVTDNTEWAALTTGALCAYDNDLNNV